MTGSAVPQRPEQSYIPCQWGEHSYRVALARLDSAAVPKNNLL